MMCPLNYWLLFIFLSTKELLNSCCLSSTNYSSILYLNPPIATDYRPSHCQIPQFVIVCV